MPEPYTPPLPFQEPLVRGVEAIVIVDGDSSFDSDSADSEEVDLLGGISRMRQIREPSLVPTKVEPARTSQRTTLLTKPPPISTVEAHKPQALCIVCKTQPAYGDGLGSLPTCGPKCAAKQQESSNRSRGDRRSSTNGRSWYETRRSSPSREPASSSFPADPSANTSKRASLLIKAPPTRTIEEHKPQALCIVCKTQPAYDDGVSSLPTCGPKCAAKHQESSNQSRGDRRSSTNGRSWYETRRSSPSREPASSSFPPGPSAGTSKRASLLIKAPPINNIEAREPQVLRQSASERALCIVCKTQPAYDDGINHYPVCGLKCAVKHRGPNNQSHGHQHSSSIQHGPSTRDSKNSSLQPGSTPLLTKPRPVSSIEPQVPQQSMGGQAMCIVCKTRPAYDDGISHYPVCGLKCALKHRGPNNQSHGHRRSSSIQHGPSIRDSKSSSLQPGFSTSPPQWIPPAPLLTKPRPVGSLEAREPQVLQRSAGGRAMCIVCKARPAYDDGFNHYQTCGLECAAKHQESINKSRGHQRSASLQHDPPIWNPTGPTLPPGFSPTNDWLGQHRPRLIKMCEVCHERPRVQKGGKKYPTCGLTCAQKLRLGNVGMCDFCGQRPKLVRRGRVYPQCGRTCRDRARLASFGLGSTTVNRASTSLDDPFLVEVPPGHVTFKRVANYFASSWDNDAKSCPAVKRIYVIALKPKFQARYEEYRSSVNSHGSFAKKGNEMKRWIGLVRSCGFGNPGNMEPCSSSGCMLCSLTRSTARLNFSDGIMTTDGPNRATDVSSQTTKRSDSKVVVIADVLLGGETEIEHDQMVRPLPPQGSDSVRVIGYHPYTGAKVDFGEVIVYNGDAIKPLYLISFT